MTDNFFIYLLVAASITYLIRMLPLVLVKHKIQNRFLLSFLYYVPYAVLSVMTVPAMFYASEHIVSAVLGFAAAFAAAYKSKSLVTVACFACLTVFVCEAAISLI
ncbi:MAG: AzlD domain-containing protein [Clostridia bacterium]|nr:AzlD domain-containing protein [Clostridia bacterium]